MKNSKYKTLFVLFGLIFSLFVFSQENFIPGYIIQQNGDTVKGLINYLNWEKNPNQISFKETKSSNIKEYKPLEIIAFSVLDETYKSAIVKVDQSNIKYGISSDPEFEFRTDTAFVLTIIQGSKSLYYYCDRNRQHNFYIYNNSNYELLEFKEFNRIHEGHLFHEMNNRYIGQLILYFQDCHIKESKFQNISYTLESIEKLFKYYYSQMKPEVVSVKKKEKTKVEVGVIGGICMTGIVFTSASELSAFDYITKVKFDKDLSLTGGVFLNIVLPRNKGKWSLYNELLYNSYSFDGFYSDFNNSNYYQNKTYKLGYYYLKMNNMIRFKFPVGKFQGFANAGFSNGFVFKEVNRDIVETKFYSDHTIVENKVLEETRKHEQGLLFGFGLIHKRISAEIRYEAGTGISEYTYLGCVTNRYNLILGYRF
ncbi:MAG: hypothetical protein Q8904_03930 [Bacteroidota bacterium]|nr:hypothetical protein [Bacteroidota bacterium]